MLESLINDVAGFRPEGLQGRYFPVQVFSTEISEIFNNSYFWENLYLQVTLFTVHEKDTANEG